MRTEHDREESNGGRLARLRRRHRLTQQQLADRVGYSLSTIQAFEQEIRSLDRPNVILRLADALGCHPTEITGAPHAAPQGDRDTEAATAAVPAVHRALLVHNRPPRISDEEASDVDLAELTVRVDEATDLRHAADLTGLAKVLPPLLRDLQVAAVVCPAGDERRRAYALLATAYEASMQFAYKLGHVAISTLAVERVRWTAQEAGDPLREIAAEWYWAGEFIAIGEHDLAEDIIDGALRQVERHRDDSPQAVSLRGAFALKAALNAARADDTPAATRWLERAQEAADDLGEDRNDYNLQFGPTNVALWRVSIPVELGRGRDAVRLGDSLTVPKQFAAERRCHHQIDLGRGYFYNGQPEKALDAFLTAERIAPQQTRMHPGVQETVRTMNRNQRRSRLTEFAARVGVL